MKELNSTSFKEEINKDKVAIIDFWAAWCGPCKMMAPNFEEAEQELASDYNFYKCNVDENSDLAIEYNVYSIPTIVAFKNGKEIARNVGFLPSSELKNWIKTQK